jgi:hypothetical protein
MSRVNNEVSLFLNEKDLPLRKLVDRLRELILLTSEKVTEDVKWNGPNYKYEGKDRITLRIFPVKQVQIIFHRGAKNISSPAKKLIKDTKCILSWKTNDRALISFTNEKEFNLIKNELIIIIQDWLNAK